MTIANEYRQQYCWRSWATIYDQLPDLQGTTVLDLGCGIGDIASDLTDRGAQVTGVDGNDEFIAYASKRNIAGARFMVQELSRSLDVGRFADGIWSSFTVAYFPDLSPVLRRWSRALTLGGWIALTEINDLFAHEPVSRVTRATLNEFASASLAAGKYDFRMGGKMATHLRTAGFEILKEFTVADRELTQDGPLPDQIIGAWRARFQRMDQLRKHSGPRFAEVRDDFLDCLRRHDHRSATTVRCTIAKLVTLHDVSSD